MGGSIRRAVRFGMLAAGVFVSDPIAGYPPGSGETTEVSWHGLLHLAAGTVSFGSLVVAAITVFFTVAAALLRAGKAR